MCGRFVQYNALMKSVEELSPHIELINDYAAEPIGRHNVAQSSRAHVLHATEYWLHIDAIKWGWAPSWAKGKHLEKIYARVETIATGTFFAQIWPSGRAIVPCEGWYEWVEDPENPNEKQPYFIRLKSRRPMLFGALAEVSPGPEHHEGDGFVIITAASDQGMVGICGRHPLVLSPAHASEWLNPNITAAQAEKIAMEFCQQKENFEWLPCRQGRS